MTIAITFPGKMGDLLWALPTIRAISRTYDVPVTLYVSQYLAPIVPLLNQQPYILLAIALSHWAVEFGAPVTPRTPPGDHALDRIFDKVFHLGLEGWPMDPLPFETLAIAGKQTLIDHEHFSLTEPWITTPHGFPPISVAVGFTDEHFELKYGVWELLTKTKLPPGWQSISGTEGSRWNVEGKHAHANWIDVAAVMRATKVFFGCCSALHVLAVGMGKPAVIMEPNPHRHHPIFWPCGTAGPQVTQVIGGDGQWTWDARHCLETIRRFL